MYGDEKPSTIQTEEDPWSRLQRLLKKSDLTPGDWSDHSLTQLEQHRNDVDWACDWLDSMQGELRRSTGNIRDLVNSYVDGVFGRVEPDRKEAGPSFR